MSIPNFEENKLSNLWSSVKNDLLKEIGKSNFELWFENFKIDNLDENEITLSAPGEMYVIWVEENFKDLLKNVFEKNLGKNLKIKFKINSNSSENKQKEVINNSVQKEKINKVKTKNNDILISKDEIIKKGIKSGLVESFKFDNFVPGDNSELAWAASKAVSNKPGKTYQPLFFYSGCGLGKTHLLHAIGWESIKIRPKSKILFITAEQFANEYISSIQQHSLVSFRKKYRELDLLLLDDVQFLSRKEGLQRELFHTFNQLIDRHCQMVLASDCPASEINELEDRLSSRFQWGLSVEIHRPGLETRAAILRQKRDDWNMDIKDEIINSIVENIHGNVRILEGALIRVAMVSTIKEKPITVDAIPKILSDLSGNVDSTTLGIEEIKQSIAEHYDLDISILNGKKRTSQIVEARQISMYLIRTLTDLSLVEIASSFGKDHGTVIHAIKKIKQKIESSSSVKSTIEIIKRRLVRGASSFHLSRNYKKTPFYQRGTSKKFSKNT